MMASYKTEKLQNVTVTPCDSFSLRKIIKDVKVRNPYTGLDRPLGLKEIETTKISMQLEMVKLSALRTGRHYLQETDLVLISVTS
jgi:hypothetical protein